MNNVLYNHMNNPLASYLRRRGLSQVRFAEIITQMRGWRIQQSAISRWITGRSYPSQASISAIAAATGGRISARDWQRWKNQQNKTPPLNQQEDTAKTAVI